MKNQKLISTLSIFGLALLVGLFFTISTASVKSTPSVKTEQIKNLDIDNQMALLDDDDKGKNKTKKTKKTKTTKKKSDCNNTPKSDCGHSKPTGGGC